jgi:endonuclease G
MLRKLRQVCYLFLPVCVVVLIVFFATDRMSRSFEILSPICALYGGLPVTTSPRAAYTVLLNQAYLVGYSEERGDPLWVAYGLLDAGFPARAGRPSWRTDERTNVRVASREYGDTGYDRGQMAPGSAIAHCYGTRAQAETFLMSNVCPQSPAMSRSTWRQLESAAERYARTLGGIWVFSGPVFEGDPRFLQPQPDGGKEPGRSGAAIPDAFYTILLSERCGSPRALAFLVPQSASGSLPLEGYLTSIDAVEERTGLDFLPQLEDGVEKPLEAQVGLHLW